MEKLYLKGIIVLLLINANLFAQKEFYGYPQVDIYESDEFNGDSQNWDIIQDNLGILLVGNNTNVKEFDGRKWRTIPVNQRRIRNFSKTESGRIFLSAYGEMGYLAYDKKGDRVYVSLIDQLATEDQPREEVWHCEANDQEAYFSTYSTLYHYDHTTLKPLDFEPSWPHVNKVGQHIFLFETQNRFSYLQNGEKYTLPHLAEATGNNRIQNVLPYKGGKLLIFTYKNEFIVYDFKKLLKKPFDQWSESTIDNSIAQDITNNLDPFLVNMYRRYSISLNGKGYAFSGNSKVVITDEDLNVKKTINKGLGTDRESIKKLYCDNLGNLWCANGKGVSMIKLNSPVSLLDKNSEYDDYTLTFTKHKGNYHVGTWERLLQLAPNKYGDKDQAIIHQDNNQVWSFCPIDNHLVFGGQEGLYDYIGNKSHLIYSAQQETFYDIQKHKSNPDWLVLGGRGIRLLKIKGSAGSMPIQVTDTLIIKEVKDNIRVIEQDTNGDIWFRTDPYELFVVRINDADSKDYQIQKINDGEKYRISELAFFDSKLLVNNKGRLLQLNYDKTSLRDFEFVKHPVLTDSLDNYGIGILETSNHNLYVATGEGILIISKQGSSNFNINSAQFKGVTNLKSIYCFDEDIWGISSDAIFNLDKTFKPQTNKLFSAIIRKVTVNGDSIIQHGTFYDEHKKKDSLYLYNSLIQHESMIPELLYEENTLSFEFGTNNYDQDNDLYFQYMLMGYDEKWSPLTNESKKEYTNLNEGDYTFEVVCYDSRGNKSSTSSYRFTVLPPWYRTWYAYLLYTAIAGIIIYLVIQISLRRLKQNNLKLEMSVKEATEKIESQNTKLKQAQVQLTQIMDEVKNELGKASVELMNATTSQAGTVEEIAASIGQITVDIDDTAKHSTRMLKNAQSVEENAALSVNMVAKTVDAIESITSEIGFVSDFARMTNLLSINAAIEAARAGESGKTFSEVAKQVKSLAEKSQKIAVNISNLSESGLQQSHEANTKIIELKDYIQQTVQVISEIHSSSQNQASQANEINNAIQDISNHIQTTTGLAEKLDEAINSLSLDKNE